jgi:ribose/xylose/arabinose/galactoside ABC-type transport system permease subunit
MYFVIHKTRLGMMIRAATSNREMAASLGVNIPLLFAFVFAFGVALAAFAGTISAPIASVSPGMGNHIVIICFVVVIIGGIGLHKTKFGRYTYAIGSNEISARRVGISVDRKLIQIYALSGFLAGFAGILSLAQFGTTTIAGQSLTNLNVIAAVVIGGTSIFGGQGSMFGSMIGLFIPATLQSGFVIIGVSPYWQTVAVGAILIAAVYVDQQRRAAASRGKGVAT